MHVVLNYNSMLHSLIGLRVVVNNNQTFSSILKFEFTVDENHHLLMVRQLCYAPIESRALSRFTGFITLSVFVTNPIFVLATKKPRLCLHVEQGTILYRSSPSPDQPQICEVAPHLFSQPAACVVLTKREHA